MPGLRVGIKIKITVAFSAVFALLAVIFNIYSYQHIRGLLIEDNDRWLTARATSLLEKTDISPVIIPLPDKDHFLRVFYHTAEGDPVVFESPGLPKGIVTPASTGISDTLGMRVAYVRHSRNSNEDNPAELLLVTSAAPLYERIHSLINLLFISSLVIVCIAGCISYLLAGVLLQPLQRIIEAARKINSNRLRDLIPVNSTHDELQELTETLNAMLTRIDHSLRQQQAFFASASHELKTPLAVLRAELELNLLRPETSPAVRELLLSQLAEIRRLQERINEFLVVSQVKDGSLRLGKTATDLSASVLRVFTQLMPMMTQRNLTPSIKFDPESDGYVLFADEDKVTIVLLNLLENAIKYAVAGTTVVCRVGRSGERSISIAMENVIAEESMDTRDLQQAYTRGTSLPGGAGIGLWLCDEIVRLHDGRLVITSGDHLFSAEVLLPA